MIRKQTRKSVSISGELYESLKAHCEREGLTMSGVMETLGREHLGMSPRQLKPAKPEVVRTQTSVAVDVSVGPRPGTRMPVIKSPMTKKERREVIHKKVTGGGIFTF